MRKTWQTVACGMMLAAIIFVPKFDVALQLKTAGAYAALKIGPEVIELVPKEIAKQIPGGLAVKDLAEKLESAMACKNVHQIAQEVPGETGFCHPSGHIKAMISMARPNVGLIQRFNENIGDDQEWRAFLSDPLVLELATLQPDLLYQHTARYLDISDILDKEGRVTEPYKVWLRGFVERRASEAPGPDRQKIVDLWGKIIIQQAKLHGGIVEMPDFLK